MENVLEAIVNLLDALARFENIPPADAVSCDNIDASRARILGAACRAAAAEIHSALIRAARI